ncbi:MAG: hypothetical protein AABY07_00280 [Nanoarchaeota archaeon]
MASTFSISKYNGVSPGTETVSMAYLHLINQDVAANGVNDFRTTAANQITIPDTGNVFSYEIWLRGKWAGAYTEITNFKVWRSAGPVNGAGGLTFKAGVNGTTYVQPINTASTIALDSTFENETDAIVVAVAGAAPNTISNFLVMQLTVASTAVPGDIGASTFSAKWTES